MQRRSIAATLLQGDFITAINDCDKVVALLHDPSMLESLKDLHLRILITFALHSTLLLDLDAIRMNKLILI